MSKQKKVSAKATMQEKRAYLELMGTAAKDVNILKIDIDKGLNLIDTETGEQIFSFDNFNADAKKVLVPEIEESENEFSNVAESENLENEFEEIGNYIFPDFWDTSNPIVGEFLGQGRTVISKANGKPVDTFIFWNHTEKKLFVVPQWGIMKWFFNGEKFKPFYNYRLTYEGTGQNQKGTFEKVKIEIGKSEIKNHFDDSEMLNKAICPIEKK